MDKEEFDTLKVGDLITNKVTDKDYQGKPITLGYDYVVVSKTKNTIKVKELQMGQFYSLNRASIIGYLNLRKK